MKTVLIILGVLAGVLLLLRLFRAIRTKARYFFGGLLGIGGLIPLLRSVDQASRNTPRSLNGCDRMLLPAIRKDFPDFDVNQAKINIRRYLTRQFENKTKFQIYNTVIARYLPGNSQKTIVFQASLSWQENGSLLQKRFDIHYAYAAAGSTETVAANCPNCGGALGYGETQCSFCGSRVTGIMGYTWKVIYITET